MVAEALSHRTLILRKIVQCFRAMTTAQKLILNAPYTALPIVYLPLKKLILIFLVKILGALAATTRLE